jgi:hypothetical protein
MNSIQSYTFMRSNKLCKSLGSGERNSRGTPVEG